MERGGGAVEVGVGLYRAMFAAHTAAPIVAAGVYAGVLLVLAVVVR